MQRMCQELRSSGKKGFGLRTSRHILIGKEAGAEAGTEAEEAEEEAEDEEEEEEEGREG